MEEDFDFEFSINTDGFEALKCQLDFSEFSKYVKTTKDDGTSDNIPLHWKHIRALVDMLPVELRLVLLKCRQIMCSWILIAYAVWSCWKNENIIVVFISKGQKEAREMIRRAYEIYDRLPPFITDSLKIKDGPRNQQYLEFSNKSRIISYPATADASRSIAAKIVVVDEAAYVRALAGLMATIAPQLGKQSQFFIVSTPNPYPVGKEFRRVCKESKQMGYRRVDLHYRVCPTYDSAWEAIKRKELSPQKFAYEYELSLATAGDASIFPLFSDRNIMTDTFLPTQLSIIIRCIDPGPVMGVIWFAEDLLGNIVVYREKYFKGGSFERRAKIIIAQSEDEIYEATIIDSADPVAQSELAKHGVYSRDCPRKDVLESIDMINAMLEGNALDTPLLQIHDSCTSLIQQMREYVGDENGYPVKGQYDHGIDALRYGVHFRIRIRRKRKNSSVDIEQVDGSDDIDKMLGIDILSESFRDDEFEDRQFNENEFDLGGF